MKDIPSLYLEKFDGRKHIALLHNDSDYARALEFEFLEQGVKKGESCAYATENPSRIVKEMKLAGLPFQSFLDKKLISVFEIKDPFEHPQGPIEGSKENFEMITSKIQPPFRIVSRLIPNVSTIEGIAAEIKLEENFHAQFEKFDCSVMCTYDISKIEKEGYSYWMKKIFENHHAVIYAPNPEKGGVFKMYSEI